MIASAFYGSPSTFTNPSLDRPLINGYHCWTMFTIGASFTRNRIAGSRELGALVRQNIRLARRWATGQLGTVAIDGLRGLTETFGFSLSRGDLHYLDGGWYITHTGLLRLAQRRRCVGIRVQQVRHFCDPVIARWIFKATVYTSPRSKGFVGYGDADPSNVSPLVRGAEMRVAETRAVNRALRKAYGIGLCSVEELGGLSEPPKPSRGSWQSSNGSHSPNGSNNGQPRLRDQLCLLIRQYNLDPTLVKAYAADFCGTETLKGASRDLVESFISHLSSSAKEDLDGLICKLNSYSHPVEVKQ